MVNHIHDSPVEDFERSHKEIINVCDDGYAN